MRRIIGYDVLLIVNFPRCRSRLTEFDGSFSSLTLALALCKASPIISLDMLPSTSNMVSTATRMRLAACIRFLMTT